MKRYPKVLRLLIALLTFGCSPVQGAPREGETQELPIPSEIQAVEAVRVECPVGTAPRLPYQLWVTYADGHMGGTQDERRITHYFPLPKSSNYENQTVHP